MRRDLITSVLAIVLITITFGVGYPLVVTGVAQVAFPTKANGSKITLNGRVVGSRLIAQDFSRQPRYFQERPSTATSYNAAGSAFTNLGPNSVTARNTFRSNLQVYLRRERRYVPGLTTVQVPIDAVTTSASGIDPDISQANAAIQAHRVAAARNLPLSTVKRLIVANTDGRFLSLLGEPAVNVLELNIALDRLKR